MEYLVRVGEGELVGPVNVEQIRRGLVAGKLPPNAVARRVGGTDWTPIAIVLASSAPASIQAAVVPAPETEVDPADSPKETKPSPLRVLAVAAALPSAYLAYVILTHVILTNGKSLLDIPMPWDDKAKPAYEKCLGYEAKRDWSEALTMCSQAVEADSDSKSGKAAAERLPGLRVKVATKEKADAMAKAEQEAREAKAASARKVAQDAEDAKCKKWRTICTLGRWPDGSEKTGGAQYFKTRGECNAIGPSLGVKCDPCACGD